MDGHNLVAVYVSRRDAEPVRDRLIEFGIPATDIRLSSADADASTLHAGARDTTHGANDRICYQGRTPNWFTEGFDTADLGKQKRCSML